MKLGLLLLWTVAAVSARVWAQEPGYPITVVPPGKGPYQFPQGYQTPWDKIEMLVTEKLAPNLYSLHGSAGLDPAHPDAAGGRVAVLFGSDGVLMAWWIARTHNWRQRHSTQSGHSPVLPLRSWSIPMFTPTIRAVMRSSRNRGR